MSGEQERSPSPMREGVSWDVSDNPSMSVRTRILLASALVGCAGAAIAWVDSRPGWDDTGVTAGVLLITAAFGGLAGLPAWAAALLVAGPIVATEISGGTGVLLAIPFAAAGGLAGSFARGRMRGRGARENRR